LTGALGAGAGAVVRRQGALDRARLVACGRRSGDLRTRHLN
jgi:hypothetical protein